MRGKLSLVLFCVLIFSSTCVFAVADVAYLYRSVGAIDEAYVLAFEDMGLVVDFIDDKDLRDVDLTGYDLVFVGNEKFRNLKCLPDVPVVVANRYYARDFGFMDKGRPSSFASNSPLSLFETSFFEVYDRARYDLGKDSIPYYFIREKYLATGVKTVAKTPLGYKRKVGSVIAYLPDKCFFGIVEAPYWTEYSSELFEACVNHVLPSGVHDVEIDRYYSSSVNGIRIKDAETGDYLIDSAAELNCNKKYKIDFKTVNVGDFVEDVNVWGEFDSFYWDSQKIGLDVGGTTTVGSKTINVTFPEGVYDIRIFSEINGDVTPLNNYAVRSVRVVC